MKQNNNNIKYGNYCYYRESDEKLLIKLTLKENSIYYIYYLNFEIEVLDSCKGKIIKKKNKLLLRPIHNKDYEIKKLGDREDDSTFIYCYKSSYDIVDTSTIFQVVNDKDEVIKDYFTPEFGIIKLLVDDNSYLKVISNEGNLPPYWFEKILNLKKGRNYYLWLSLGSEEILHKYNFFKLNDTAYSLKQYSQWSSPFYSPMKKCD